MVCLTLELGRVVVNVATIPVFSSLARWFVMECDRECVSHM